MVTIAAGPSAFASLPPSFWDDPSIDIIGLAAWFDFPFVNKSSSLADDLADGWRTEVIPMIEHTLASMQHPKQVLVLEYGVQSRPNAFHSARGESRPDEGDCSGWLECYDMDAQAESYEGFLRAMTPKSWFAGVYWWLVRADPSAGGTCDSDYTPAAKPAAAVVRRWYGFGIESTMSASVGATGEIARMPGGLDLVDWSLFKRSNGSAIERESDLTDAPRLEEVAPGTGAVVNARYAAINRAVESRDARRLPAGLKMRNDSINGFVFGGAAEWSSPAWRYDSPGAAESLRMAKATGANAVEIIVQWFCELYGVI